MKITDVTVNTPLHTYIAYTQRAKRAAPATAEKKAAATAPTWLFILKAAAPLKTVPVVAGAVVAAVDVPAAEPVEKVAGPVWVVPNPVEATPVEWRDTDTPVPVEEAPDAVPVPEPVADVEAEVEPVAVLAPMLKLPVEA